MKKKGSIKFSFLMLASISLSFFLLLSMPGKVNAATNDRIFLSDVEYMESSYAKSGYSIKLDTNNAQKLISLNVDGQVKTFLKGISAWATSELIYDVGDLDYDYFTSYLGVDYSQQNTYYNNGVTFYIYTSTDGESWTQVYKSGTLKGWDQAEYVQIDISQANYLKLYAYENGNSWYSQWYDDAVYADAKLIKEGYVDNNQPVDFIKTLSEYDNIIKNRDSYDLTDDQYDLLLLQREFVNKCGYDLLMEFINLKDDYKTIVQWLMTDIDNLRLYIHGGNPAGDNYFVSLDVLMNLYKEYGSDLENNTVSQLGTRYGDLYKKMMISLSLTHSQRIRFWLNDSIVKEDGTTSVNADSNSPNISNAATRYQIYKAMYVNGDLNNEIFENLEIEEMRYIMGSNIPDGEIKWLHDYTTLKGSTNPYSYLNYTTSVNYMNDQYYSTDNYATWNTKYDFSSYGIGYKAYYPRLWIVFEQGGVCWQISNTGQNIYSSYGVPSTTVGQPGHVAYLLYSLNNAGDGMWNIWNDVSGWTKTNDQGYSADKSYYSIRWLCGWGNQSWCSSYEGSYILLAQAALNDFENYEEAEEILLLANSYSNDNQMLEEIYNDALEVQNINLDAWYGLVNLYANDDTKTDAQIYSLAVQLTSALKYYPLPMNDLLKILINAVDSTGYEVSLTLLQESTLQQAAAATEANVLQSNVCKIMANHLLGTIDTEVATFSFDGENAGVLSLTDKFADSQVTWDYSLDGGTTWVQVTEHSVQLSAEQLASITQENDILVHIIGVDYSEENIYTIDITVAPAPALGSLNAVTGLYANDDENEVIYAQDTMEWQIEGTNTWTSFADSKPDLSGNVTVNVRYADNGCQLQGDSVALTFTEDQVDEEHKYISIARLSIESYYPTTFYNNKYTSYAIDGSIYSIWHSASDATSNEKYVVLKLDQPTYISALKYYPNLGSANGRILNAKILVSEDGQDWTEVVESTSWANDTQTKYVEFEATYGQYIKIVGTQTQANFITAALINVYEDTTITHGTSDTDTEEENIVPEDTEEENAVSGDTVDEEENTISDDTVDEEDITPDNTADQGDSVSDDTSDEEDIAPNDSDEEENTVYDDQGGEEDIVPEQQG